MRICVQWGPALLVSILASACGDDGDPQAGDSSSSSSSSSSSESTSSSSSSSSSADETTASAPACEAIANVCEQITVDDVNAALMTMPPAVFDSAMPQNMDGAMGPVNGCNYGIAGMTFATLTRNCFTDGVTAAADYYQAQKDGPATTEGEEVIEVPALGDDAHLRIVPVGDNASLVVLDGDRVHFARRLGIMGMSSADVEAQLRPLGAAMLDLD